MINPVDLGVILLLFLLGIVLLKQYRPEPLNLKQQLAVYRIVVPNVPAFVSESLAVGQELIHDPTGISLGVIYEKRRQPAEILLVSGGRLNLARSPRNYDIHLGLRRYARIIRGPTQFGVYVNRLPIRVGAPINAHTLTTQIKGQIEYLRVQKVARFSR